ncbi:prolyl oligopeptidase family serine peptidase [Barrientosiimonas marina]|uniref:Esterase n=1 Tax=Lentibacillus kimchii TaxID=1542911 RepID=A0ABW2UQT5_9BACI
MIGVTQETIANVPSLVIVDHAKEYEALPTVTFFHGFTSAKEHNLPLAYLLAEEGFRIILPDSMHHGERDQGISSMKIQLAFWDIVMQNVAELQAIKNELDEQNLVLDNRFGIAGTSMGGITSAAALTQYPWIKTAGILMGTPKLLTYAKTLVDGYQKVDETAITDDMTNDLYAQLEAYDLSNQIDKLADRPVLFWHGEHDEVVPFNHSYAFYENAQSYYSHPENIRFLSEANRGHKVSRYAILETVRWFKQHL